MGVWSRVGDQENPTAYRYTYSTKTDETTGNKNFSLRPYLFDTNFLNKLERTPSLRGKDIMGVKVVYTVSSGYAGSWKVQGRLTYTNDTNEKEQFESAISSSFIVNSNYKRIVQTINFNKTVKIDTLIKADNGINFIILIKEFGYGTLHWHVESGMTTYIDLLVGTSSGAVDSNIITPGEEDEFKRFVDPIEVRLKNSSDITEIKLDGSGSPPSLTKTININPQTEWPIEFGTWPYEERVIINGYKANNVLAFTRNINIISEEYFNLNPSVYRMKKNEENKYQRSFDGTFIELNLNFKISNNSFMEQSNSKNLKIQIYKQSSSNFLYSQDYSITNTTENFVINIAPITGYTINADLQDTLIVKIFLDNSNPSNLLFTQDILISKAVPIFNIEENGVAIGRFSSGQIGKKKFEVAEDYTSYFDGRVEINGITKFESNVASDNSTQIGAFGDYPIYMSQFIVDSIPNPSKPNGVNWYSINIKTGLSTSVHLIHAYGYITFSSGSEFPINYFQSTSNFSMGYLFSQTNSKDFVIHCQNNANTPTSYMIILIYYDTSQSLSS